MITRFTGVSGPGDSRELPSVSQNDGRIFVFGSNLAGIHGAGAAKWAFEHRGAVWGKGVGLHGQSYAIPTKNRLIRTLHIDIIATYIADFLCFASVEREMRFQLTPIGCGLAGYVPVQIAPMFLNAPSNVDLPPEFLDVVRDMV